MFALLTVRTFALLLAALALVICVVISPVGMAIME
jgi:hypothetical protein